MQNNKSRLGLGIVLGAAAGALAGLFLAPKAGKELREDAMKIYKRLQTEDPKKIAREVLGDVSAESQKLIKRAYEDLSVELASLKKKYANIDTEKYQSAIKKVLSSIKDEGNIPEGSMKKLASYLEADAKKLVARPTKDAKAVAKKVTKTVKKAVKTAKKTVSSVKKA